MRTLDSPEVYRSMGAWNEATQQALLDTHIAIGGVGGAGYLAGIELAHMGVQNFSVADPEGMDDVNGNRVLGATTMTYGLNKALVFAQHVQNINQDAQVNVFTEGVNAGNVGDFMDGAHLVLDATELSMPELGTMVCRQAREQGIPVVNAEYVLHGAQVTSFDPNSRWTFERAMKIRGGAQAPLEDVAKQRIETARTVAYIPPYADMETLKAMEAGAPLPSNMTGAGQAALMVVAETLKHARQRVGERGLPPVFYPHVRWMDVYTGESGRTKHPVASFYRGVIGLAVRNKLGLYEPASYTVEQRAARGDTGSMNQ